MARLVLFAGPMRRELPTVLFIAYLVLDLSSPFVPGAFRFNPEECVEAAQRAWHQQAAPVSLQVAGRLREPPATGAASIRPSARAASARRAPSIPMPVTHAALDPPPPGSPDDH